MSYLDTPGFYVNQPSAYVRTNFDSRVPGWGPVRHAAGPSMWGVGAIAAQPALRQKVAAMRTTAAMPVASQRILGGGGAATTAPAADTGGVPWWVWVAAPAAIGGLLLLGYDLGWFGD